MADNASMAPAAPAAPAAAPTTTAAPSIDYAALAAQHGGAAVQSAPAGGSGAGSGASSIDYAALASQHGGSAVDADTPAAAAAPATPTPTWRDRLIGSLTKPRAGHDASTILGRAANWAETINPEIADWRQQIGGAAELALHPVDTATSLAHQAADAEVLGIAGKEGYEHALSKPEAARTADDNRVIQAAENFKSMGKGMWQQFLDDPQKFLNEQIGQAALTHGMGEGLGAAGDLAKKGLYKAGAAAGESLRSAVGTDATASSKTTAAVQRANVGAEARADAANQRAQTARQNKIEGATAENERRAGAFQERVDTAYQKKQQADAAAQQKVQDQNAADLQDHMEAVDKAGQDRARKDAAYEARVRSAQITHDEALNEVERIKQSAADTSTKRGQLDAEDLDLQRQLGEAHVRNMKGAQASIARQASSVASKISDLPGQQQSLAQSMFKKDYADLTPDEKLEVAPHIQEAAAPMVNILEAVAKAKETDLKGSETGHPLLSSIERYAEDRQAGNAPSVSFDPRSVNTPVSMQFMDYLMNDPHASYESLPENKRAMYDSLMKSHEASLGRAVDDAAGDGSVAVAEGEDGGAGEPGGIPKVPQITYSQLSGYITELGRRIRQLKISKDHPGDVIAALERVRGAAEDTAEKMAKDAGPDVVQARTQMRRHYQAYRETFKEPDSLSPTSKATRAATDWDANNYQASRQYLTEEELATGRGKRMLVGTKSGPRSTPHYDPESGQLIDRLQEVARQKKRLKSPEALQTKIESAQAKAAKPAPAAEIAPGQAGPAAPGAVRRLLSETPKPEPTPPEPRPIPQPVEGPLKPVRPIGETPLRVPKPLTAADMQQPNYVNMSMDKIRKLNGDAVEAKVAKLKSNQMQTILKSGVGTLSTIGGLAAAVFHPSAAAAAFEGGAMVAGLKPMLSGMSDLAVRYALAKPEVLEMLKQPSRAQLREFSKLPEAQRPGVAAALQQMNDAAVKSGALKSPSPWMQIIRDISTAGVATRSASDNKAAADAAAAAQAAASAQAATDEMMESTGLGGTQ